MDTLVEFREHGIEPGAAAQHAGFAADHARGGAGIFRNQRGGDITAADVLGQRRVAPWTE